MDQAAQTATGPTRRLDRTALPGVVYAGSWLAGSGLHLPHFGGEGAALFEITAA